MRSASLPFSVITQAPPGAGIDATQSLQRFGHVRGHAGLHGARFRIVGNDAQPMSQFAFLETMQCHA